MGKPATSCFKIIGCGGSGVDNDAVDDDDLAPKEAKASSDKSRWSFRKKSSKHRILSNSVISEPIPVCSSKESQEVSTANFNSPRYSFPDKAKVPEKSFETSPLPVDIVNTETSSLYDRSTTPVGATINESGVTPVGAAINESDVTPVGATINESDVTPVGASINESDVNPVGATINEPDVAPVGASLNGSSVSPVGVTINKPDVAPVGASLNESSVSPVGVTISEPDVAPVGASLNESSVSPVGVTINESDAILFQAVIRGYLARKELHKLKSLVKLQATVRGHLVRRQAVGTLRCIQAIMKMQALLRAHHARQFIRKLTSPEDRKLQVNGHYIEKPSRTSTKKLLSNGFARQLLETTPRTKSFYIKCDPSKHDSTWQWLERWMAVASPVGQTDMQSFNHDNQAVEGKDYMVVPSEPVVAPMEDDVDNHLVIENVNNFGCRTSVIAPSNSFDSSLKDDVEKPESKNELLDTTIQDYTDSEIVNEETMDHVPDDKQLKPTVSSEILADTVPGKLESGKENHSDSTERSSTETLENEGKRSVMSSRKSCNPAFVAAQSKFEELSLKSTVGRSASAYKNAAPKSKTESQEKQNIEINSFTYSSEAISAENTGLHDSRVQAAASECGTEISISSTLDSPDRSEMEGGEIVLEIGVLEKENYAIIADAENAFDLINLGGDEKPVASDQTMANSNASTSLVQSDQQSAEPTASDVLTNLEGTIEQIRSPEGTPRSHIPASDLHGTPSSDVSVDAKMSKKDNNVLTHKKKSQLVDKRSPNPNDDSSGRSSTENLTKDSKIPRRRSSFAVTKADHVDQEPRLSTSNPLPGYMQATASARAKAHVSPTQKSSLDLNDNHSKKRHSLPIENGKHNSSPRMQRSASQAHQTGKDNGAHSPRNSAERKWQR